MEDQLPDELKQERADELMAVQQEVAFGLALQRVGRKFEVLIEDEPRDGAQPARHAGQAPEVDSLTYVTGRRCEPGEFVEVRCTAAREYDLIAQPTGVILPVIS